MMKKISQLIAIVIFFQGSINAQETLLVRVGQLNNTDSIILKWRGTTLRTIDTISSSSNWFIEIDPASNSNDFSVILSNLVAPLTRKDLAGVAGVHEVRNDSLVNGNFKLTGSISIKIVKTNGQNAKEYTRLIRNVDAPPRQGGPGSGTANYKIGSAVYDALYLNNPAGDNKTKLKILAFYANVDTNITAVDTAYRSNKFLIERVNEIIAQLRSVPGQQNLNLGKAISSAVTGLGGLDVTTIADGFAKFLVKRTKEELNVAFFDRFKKFISDPRYIDLQTVFPQTYRALIIIGDEIYNYEAYIQTLRESFENDLSTLDENLPTIIDNHPEFFNRYPYLAALLNSGCYIAGALEDKVHPGDILSDYPTEFLDSLNKNVKASIKTIQVISASVKDTAVKTDSVYWVNAKTLKKIIADSSVLRSFLGLVYEQVEREAIIFNVRGTDTAFKGILDQVADQFGTSYKAYSGYIARFSEKTTKLNELINNYSKTSNDSLKFEQYYKYFSSSVDLIQHATDLAKLPYIKNVVPDLADSLKDYFDVCYSAANLVLDVNRRNYASAVTNAVHIYDVVKARYSTSGRALSKRRQRKLNKKVNKEVADLMIKKEKQDGSFQVNASEIREIREKQEEKFEDKLVNTQVKDDTLRKLYKYGTFMAAVVQAKSSDDVSKAIEAFALPTGSSRIKRETAFNVSLNAYTGLFVGHEYIRGVKIKKVFNTYGVTAPIGVAISRGHSIFFISTGEKGWATGKRGWSTSFFVSLVDLGAVAAYRFKDDSTTQVPTIQLKSIFSPGAFFSIGIPKTPLSFNLGAQAGPNLRKLKTTDTQTSEDSNDRTYWRVSASLCVDIPLVNFYTKSR